MFRGSSAFAALVPSFQSQFLFTVPVCWFVISNWWNFALRTAPGITHLFLLCLSSVIINFLNIIKAKLESAQQVWNEWKGMFVFLDLLQAVSLQLQLQDLLVRTGLRDQSRLLLGPFSCSASLEARWCRHSGSPGPEPGPPKLLLDLNGGLLQVRSSMTQELLFNRFVTSSLQVAEVRVRSAPLHLGKTAGFLVFISTIKRKKPRWGF